MLISLTIGTDFSTAMRAGNVQTGRIIVNKIGCKLADAFIDQAINYDIYVLTDGLGNWYVDRQMILTGDFNSM